MTTTTHLVNELLKKVVLHPNFEVWQHQGKLPEKELKMLWESLKVDPRYSDLPARFLTSAKLSVSEIYDSWLATQKSQRLKLDGITRWLEIIKSDTDLVQSSGHNLEQIRSKAYEILTLLDLSLNLQADPPPKCEEVKKKRGRRKADPHSQDRQQVGSTGKATNLSNTKQLFSDLFDAYCSTEESDTLSRCAISHLIKNSCRVNEQEEDVEKLSKRLQKKRKEVDRLREQLISRVPRGRDLDGEEFLKTLDIASQTVPQNEAEALSWQASLLKRPTSTPFPILFFSNADLHWSCIERQQYGNQDLQKRIFVRCKGLDKKYLFEVYCDRRQLPLFQQFLEDEQTYTNKQNQGEYSSSLFLLRSAVLLWREDESNAGKRASRKTNQSSEVDEAEGKPWNQHRLYLHCTIETRCLSQQGTEQVRAEKADTAQKIIASYEAKEELSETQQQALKRKRSTLERLDKPFPRPSRSQYQGNADIIVGVSLGLDPPVAVAVVEASTGKTILYQSTRQLLGEDYKLLSQYRHRQNQHSNQRHKSQSRGRSASITESNLGQYLDRLIARSIIVLAQAHQAGSIALPHMTGHRERIQSEITARAEQKFPSNQTAQDLYAKQYRISIHRWSYNRLIGNIQEQARKAGLSIEVGQQPTQGTLTQKAQGIAISAFHDRKPL
jgi:uncharacterized coiled-coil protein SlyX